MDAQQLEKAINSVMAYSPLPMTREGVEPTDYDIKALDKRTVSVAWVYNGRRTEFVIEQRQEAWVHTSGVTSAIENHRLWFPDFVRWAAPDSTFNETQYLNYLKGK